VGVECSALPAVTDTIFEIVESTRPNPTTAQRTPSLQLFAQELVSVRPEAHSFAIRQSAGEKFGCQGRTSETGRKKGRTPEGGLVARSEPAGPLEGWERSRKNRCAGVILE